MSDGTYVNASPIPFTCRRCKGEVPTLRGHENWVVVEGDPQEDEQLVILCDPCSDAATNEDRQQFAREAKAVR